ncbi:Ig-like domain-containing protein [Thalassotalea ganghwensis]
MNSIFASFIPLILISLPVKAYFLFEADGNLTASAGVTEPISIDTTIDSVGEAINVFDFTISDGGTSDATAMNISQIILNTSGTGDFNKVTWRLTGPDAANVTGVVGGGTITFSGLSISIADGGNETYTVNAYYNDNTGLTEGGTYILSVDGDTDVTISSGTTMGATSPVTNGSGSTVDVTATALAFTTQPAGSVSGSDLTTQPVVTAQDAFGNTDSDFTETITLTEASAGTLTGGSIAAVSGVATFTNVNYAATADQQSFTLTANDQDGVGTDLATVDANAVTSDVVATKLVFDTQPAPLTVASGEATALNPVPVVSARDANDIVDTGYVTDITLAEVNGAGSVILVGMGDTDANPETVSVAPSSGSVTYSGMQIAYTASGGSDETFNLQASSGGLTTATSSQFTATTNNVPTVSGAPTDISVTEDTASNVNLSAVTFADADGDSLTVTLNISAGTFSSPADGAGVTETLVSPTQITLAGTAASINTYLDTAANLQYTGATDVSGDNVATLTISATDGVGSLAADPVVNIDITAQPDAPTVSGAPTDITVTEDTASNVDLSAVTFADVDGDSLTVTLTVSAGTFSAPADGAGVGSGVTETLVNVTQVTLSGLALDINTYLDTASNLQYTGAANAAGNDVATLTMSASDGGLNLSSNPVVNIDITGVNDAPTGADNSATITDAATKVFAAADFGFSDVDSGDVLTSVRIDTLTVDNGTLRLSGVDVSAADVITAANIGNLVYTPSAIGTDTFTFSVNDGTVFSSAPNTFTVNVSASNVAPTAVNDTANTESGASVSINVLSNDSDSDGTLNSNSITVTQPGNGSAAVSNGQVVYTANSNFVGTDTFTYRVSDNDGALSNSATVTVTVFAANVAPVATDDTVTVNENSSVSINVLANDADGDGSLNNSTLELIDLPTNGVASISSSQIVYTPTADYSGPDSLTYRVQDDDGEWSNTATVSITVEDNYYPVSITFTRPSIQITEGSSTYVDYEVAFSPYMNASSISISYDYDGQMNFTRFGDIYDIDENDRPYRYTQGQFTPFGLSELVGLTTTVTVTATDGITTDIKTFTFEVIANNTAPYREGDEIFEVTEDTSLTESLDIVDDESNELSYQITEDAANGSVTVNAGSFTYVPNDDFVGQDSFTIIANDGEVNSEAIVYQLTVTNVNDAPIANEDSLTVAQAEDDVYLIDVLANDNDVDLSNPDVEGEEGEQLVGVAINNNSSGSALFVDGKVRYTATENFAGEVQFYYTVADSSDAQSSALVKLIIEVEDVVDGNNRPVITAPDDVTVNASGLFTEVDLGLAQATDEEDGSLAVTVDSNGFFSPGSHTVTWSTVDQDGLQANDTQTVHVVPLVSFNKNQSTSEGATVTFKVLLNGPAVSYPVVVPYTVGGTAATDGSDHNLVDGQAIIEQGQLESSVTVDIVNDGAGEGRESLIVTMGQPINAVVGTKSRHQIGIFEENIAPNVVLEAKQDSSDKATRIIAQDGGMVVVKAKVTDPNTNDSHSYDWSKTDNTLVDVDSDDTTFTFDPSSLSPGFYKLRLEVSDGDKQAKDRLKIRIEESLPELSASNDSDNDGISDLDEGIGDKDDDGIPDYLDSANLARNIIQQNQVESNQFLIETEPGLVLTLGDVAFRANGSKAAVSSDDIVNYGNDGQGVLTDEDQYEYNSGLFDFDVEELPVAGQSVSMVVAQFSPIPDNAVYRKLMPSGWQDFVIDDNNQVSSALGSEGFCPPPGDVAYKAGLTEGHWCVQLAIEDGGPNDADGEVNQAVDDPGGVAVAISGNHLPIAEPDAVTTKIGTAIVIDVLANDTDEDVGDSLTLLNVSAMFGSVEINSDQTITYTPADNHFGTDTINYTISDGNGGAAASEVTVTIRPNSAPQVVDETATLANDETLTLNVLTNDSDADGDDLVLITAIAEQGSISFTSDGEITYTPKANFVGTDTVTYFVYDGFDDTSGQLVITVEAPEVIVVTPKKSSGGAVNFSWLLLASMVVLWRRVQHSVTNRRQV